MLIGDKIRKLRTQEELTQEYIQEVTGIRRERISSIEQNSARQRNLSLKTCAKFAKVFNLSLSELLSEVTFNV